MTRGSIDFSMTTTLLTLGYCWGLKKSEMLAKNRKREEYGLFCLLSRFCQTQWVLGNEDSIVAVCEAGPSRASYFGGLWVADSEGIPGTGGSGWSWVVIQDSISSLATPQSITSLYQVQKV